MPVVAGIGISGYMDGYMCKQATKGYHYTKGGHMPANMLNLPKEEREAAMQWYREHTPDKNSDRYLRDRRRLEAAMLLVARRKLGDKVKVKHPLYFRTDYDTRGWGGTSMPKDSIYEIDEDLLKHSTFSPGDSFDYLRRERHGDVPLKELLKTLMTKKELEGAGDLDMLPRKTGNYVEGQLWSPFSIRNGKIVKEGR